MEDGKRNSGKRCADKISGWILEMWVCFLGRDSFSFIYRLREKSIAVVWLAV